MGSLSRSTVQDLCNANAAVERLKAEPFLGIKVPHFLIHKVRWATVHDASWTNAAEDHSQGAFLVGATSLELWNNASAPFAFAAPQVSLSEKGVFKHVGLRNSDHVRSFGRGRVDPWALRRAD